MASRISGITVEIGGDTVKLQAALKDVNSEIKSTETQLKDVEKLLKLDPTNTELLAQKQSLLAKAVEETNTKLQTLKTAAEQANTALANGEISQQQYDALQREIVATEQNLENLTTQANESTTALQKLAATGEDLKSMGDSIESVGTKFAPVSAAVTALGVGAIATAANFESSMSQVQATLGITSDGMSDLNGESVNTMDALSALAEQMGSETEHSASSCAEAINYLALAGYDTQQIFDTLPMVLNLASAGGIELANASDMVTDAMSALNIEVTEADSMVDQMAKTSQKTNTSVAELGEGILTIGATAQSMAGGTAELNTALGILADNGIKGSEGGTALRNVILSLQTPTDQARAIMEQLGVAVYDSQGNMRGMNDILGDLNSSMDGMTSEGRTDVIGTIFNKTDLAAVNSLLDNTGDSWEELQNTISDSTGTASQMAETQLDNLQGQLTMLKAALEGLAISLGKILLPMVSSMATSFQGFVDWLNSMDESTQKIIVGIGLFVAALGPVLIIVGKVITSVGTIMTALSKVSAVIKTVKTAFAALNLTMLANPITLIIAGITALVAAFLYFWATSEEFRQFWGSLWENIQSIAIAVWEALGTFLQAAWEGICAVCSAIFTTLQEIFSAVWEGIKTIVETILGAIATVITEVWEGICTTITTILETISSTISSIWDGITTTVENILTLLKGIFKEKWDGFKNTISDAMGNIQNTISEGWESAKTVVSTALGNMASGLSSAFSEMLSTVKTNASNIGSAISSGFGTGVSYIKDLITQAPTWGKDLISGMVSGITNSISNVTSAVKNVASTIWSYLHFSVPEVGPLTDYETWMPDFMEGLAKGIQGSKSLVTNAVDGLASDMVLNPNARDTDFGGITDEGSSSGFDVPSLITSITSAIGKMGGDTVIPVYLGGTLIDEVVVNATQRTSLRSGGH